MLPDGEAWYGGNVVDPVHIPATFQTVVGQVSSRCLNFAGNYLAIDCELHDECRRLLICKLLAFDSPATVEDLDRFICLHNIVPAALSAK